MHLIAICLINVDQEQTRHSTQPSTLHALAYQLGPLQRKAQCMAEKATDSSSIESHDRILMNEKACCSCLLFPACFHAQLDIVNALLRTFGTTKADKYSFSPLLSMYSMSSKLCVTSGELWLKPGPKQ